MTIEVNPRHRTQVSEPFLRGMCARMAMSFEKYGDVAEAFPHKVDALASLRVRLERYQETGNTEYLIDVANFAMIEFMRPSHRHAHFKAEDSAASPGRVGSSGRHLGQESNTSARENVRRGGSSGSTAGGFYQREGD